MLPEQIQEAVYKLEQKISKGNPTFTELTPTDQSFSIELVKHSQDFVVKDLPRLIYHLDSHDNPIFPPTIEEFLSPAWIGFSSNTIFPAWRKVLTEDVFGPHSIVKEIIFAGATGTGKSTAARYCLVYNMIRVLYFNQPQLMFGVDPTQVLSTIMISVGLAKAWRGLMDPIIALFQASDKFIRVKKEDELYDIPLEQGIAFCVKQGIKLPKNLVFYCGSQLSHAIGESLIGAELDEAEYRRDYDAVSKAMNFYNTMKERLENRFFDIPWTILTLVSSAASSEGVIPSYIEKVKEDNEKIRVYSYALWDVRDFDVYNKGYFYVLKGNKNIPSRILTIEEQALHEKDKFIMPTNCKIIQVPIAHKGTFESDVDRALMNTAGEVAITDLHLFTTYEPFENYETFLCPELYITSNLQQSTKLITQIPIEFFMIYNENSKYIRRAPNALRYCHIDLAESTEAGVTICHKELGEKGKVLYVVDFVMKITSPNRIEISSVQDLIETLAEEYNVNFGKITADQYQSSQMLQNLQKLQLPAGRLSVDRTLEAYYRVAGLVHNNSIRLGNSPILFSQAKAIKESIDFQVEKRTGKSKSKLITRIRKDMLDSFVGAIYNAVNDVKAEPIYSFFHENPTIVGAVNIFETEDLEEI